MTLLLALICLTITALAVYMLAPQQQLIRRKPHTLWLGSIAICSLLVGVLLPAPGYGFWPACYLALTWLMLCWLLLPLISVFKKVKYGG
ncbi:hypothetical protein [Rheinheimera sp. EpRS3]|uniref:hypothetical protein n=1 Tax=Rheinheimera sp. EpRS3 TaxID=1712383 RepID=UPI0007465BE2|nr:hypothetical protein [Rheinheimera sp. EpRS3]KUM52139.1 hypothetical protein AR688_02200 [Rheinheimera sp. EpRS3]